MGTQSPPATDLQKQLGQSAPGENPSGQISDAQQRPAASGEKGAETPGQSGQVSGSALDTAKDSAKSLGEQGGSRQEIETGKASQ